MNKYQKITYIFLGSILLLMILTGVHTGARSMVYEQSEESEKTAAITEITGERSGERSWQDSMERVFLNTKVSQLDTEFDNNLTQDLLAPVIDKYLADRDLSEDIDNDQYRVLFNEIKDRQLTESDGYSSNDLENIIWESNTETLYDYGLQLGQTVHHHSPKVEHETELVNRIGRGSGGEQAVEDLLTRVSAYREITKEMLEMEVPKEIKEEHTDLLNAFSRQSRNILYMSSLEQDPYRGLVGIKDHSKGSQMLQQAMDSVAEAMAKEGISYDPQKENPAYVFWLDPEIELVEQ